MKTIKFEDIILRSIKQSDAKDYLECHQDEEARSNFSSVPTTLEESKKEIKEGKGDNHKFAIIKKEQFVGFINLETNNHPRYKHSANVGYGIHKDYRGKGIATKSLKAIVKYGFESLNLIRISGYCRSFNKSSARVMEKSGFIHEGTLHKNKFSNGEYVDDMVWAIVK